MNREEIIGQLRASLDGERMEHTLGVEQTAGRLAERFGVDPERARLAGLLHDCAKGMEAGRMRGLIAQRGLEVDDMERRTTSLLHAPAGAALAFLKYGVRDEGILSAIRWHTTGRPDMTALEGLIYLSDVIEPTRPGYPGLDRVRAAAEQDLRRAMLLAVEDTVEYVRGRGRQLHPRSLALLDSLRE